MEGRKGVSSRLRRNEASRNLHIRNKPRHQFGVEDDFGGVGREGEKPVGENEVREELEAGL